MKMEFFSTGLLTVQKEEKWSLFSLSDGSDYTRIKPLAYAQNQPSIEVWEKDNLVILKDAVYRISDGACLVSGCPKLEVKRTGHSVVLFTGNNLLLIFDRGKLLLECPCQEYRLNERFIAVKDQESWSVYRNLGMVVAKDLCVADDVELYSTMMVASSLGRRDLYSLRKGEKMLGDQQKIVASSIHHFAICADIAGNISVWSEGKWHKELGKAEDFGIVDDKYKLFYVKRNGKCFMYNFSLTPEFDEVYPDGVDFICSIGYDKIAIIVDDELSFYFKY